MKRATSSASPMARATATTGNSPTATSMTSIGVPRATWASAAGCMFCPGTAIARLAARLAMEEFHQDVPKYQRVDNDLTWMPSSTFRSPLKLELAVH